MDDSEIQAIAATLAQARLGGSATALPPADLVPGSLEQAYRVQAALGDLLTAGGSGPVVGQKIGCTTPVMQEFLSIDHPCAGAVHAAFTFRERGTLRLAEHHQVGVECEIAAGLGADLGPRPGGDGPHDRESVAGAVEWLAGAIELVDARYQDWTRFPTTLLVADDFFNLGAVLGPPRRDWRGLDLAALTGQLWVDGALAGAGRGADILGHPLQALAWLANERARQGAPLKAGQFVLLGSVVKTVFLERPAKVRVELEGLGGAEIEFLA